MDFRQRHTTPISPRGKKPAAVVPGGLALADLAIPATPGSYRPASPLPRGGGSHATAGPGIDPSPASPWPARDISRPSVADARTRPSPPTAFLLGNCSSNTCCPRLSAPRSASRVGVGPPRSSASSARRRTGPAASLSYPSAMSPSSHDRAGWASTRCRAGRRRLAGYATAKSAR